MMLNLHSESGHPTFRATSVLERGELKVKGNKSVHCNGREETIQLILRTIISVNQLSIYGAAVADLCKELSDDSEFAVKLAAIEWKYLQNFPLLILTSMRSCRETCFEIMNINSNKLSEDQKLSKVCSDAGLNIFEKDNSSLPLVKKKGQMN